MHHQRAGGSSSGGRGGRWHRLLHIRRFDHLGCIVDLDLAVEGVARGAFGFSGQKCSATSRVYVERPVYDECVEKPVAQTKNLVVKNPVERDAFSGPVIDEDAVQRFLDAVEEVRSTGGEILTGGDALDTDGLDRGNFVAPTVAIAPEDSYVWDKELFVPFVVVGPVDSLEEALTKSNKTPFGLTAGLFASDEGEITTFFRDIDAGTTYVNRAAGATTGAWPDIQSFGGWKGSGTSGAGGGVRCSSRGRRPGRGDRPPRGGSRGVPGCPTTT
ncbi:MAG: aldehyde dehydrogenase family protein [Acidimicrobiia bacterium]|nr:aldehyde dehydrogenase family protein [Acidimicrobiia bacterium]